MKTRLHRHIISFGSCFLLTSALGYPVYAAPSKDQIDNHARANGFPRSDYPYYEPVNQCGGEGVTSKVPDKYELKVLGRVVFRADFREACNNHDRCYMTAGSNRRECDANFERDLKSRCGSVAKNPGCHAFAKPYAEVVYNVGGEFFPNAQAKARNYKSLVENFIAQAQTFFAPPYLPDYHAKYPMFDAQWYLSNNSDVNNACKGNLECAKQHYLANGLKECRNASRFFNPRWYLENNPDVRSVFKDCRGASEHWSGAGRRERRPGAPGVSAP